MAQGIHSFAASAVPFLRSTLRMSCGNPSYKSQLRLSPQSLRRPPPSPSKLSLKKPLQLLLSRPAGQAITHDEVGRFAATKSEKSKKYFLLR